MGAMHVVINEYIAVAAIAIATYSFGLCTGSFLPDEYQLDLAYSLSITDLVAISLQPRVDSERIFCGDRWPLELGL